MHSIRVHDVCTFNAGHFNYNIYMEMKVILLKQCRNEDIRAVLTLS
jgi:hypothetical protein